MVDNQIYFTYVVLSDYVSKQPVGLTALAATVDFDNYALLGIITSKGSDNKDVVIFPEKINGKYFFYTGQERGLDEDSASISQVFGSAKVCHFQSLKNTRSF